MSRTEQYRTEIHPGSLQCDGKRQKWPSGAKPSGPWPLAVVMSFSGPQLPQHLVNNSTTSQEDDPNDPNDNDDDAYGPALPPHLAAKKKSRVTQQARKTTRRSPSPVTHPKTVSSKSSAPLVQADTDSDDDFGPPPPTVGPSTSNEDAIREFKEREQRRKELAEVSYLSPWRTFSWNCSRFSSFPLTKITLLKL